MKVGALLSPSKLSEESLSEGSGFRIELFEQWGTYEPHGFWTRNEGLDG